MDFKASLGICRNCQDKGGDHKLLVVPQDPDLFEKNELVVIISAADFKEHTIIEKAYQILGMFQRMCCRMSISTDLRVYTKDFKA